MITIQIRDAEHSERTEVEIFCDPKGLADLLGQLGHLQKGSSHVHLMTPAWSGNELEEKTFGEGAKLINHLRITMLPTSS